MTNNSNGYFPADLPVFNHVEEINKAVRENQVSILTGETGSGKTTGIAQILYRAGYSDIRITQPRITAATSVAEFVASALGEDVGQTVGYMSSLNKCTGKQTKVVFITDGLQLAQEVHGNGISDGEDAVIVIDEHHERSENIDTLVAVLIERIKRGAKFRLVFSSATADVDRLQAWLSPMFGHIPHIHVSGRTFPVTENLIHQDAAFDTAVEALMDQKNVLVILPGVRQILTWVEGFETCGLDVEVLPLYADLSKEERDKVFVTDYPRPKVVVATNIAQTSITIPDLDVVVDLGLERRPTVDKYGIPGLAKCLTSVADCDQRKGRAGRVRPGESFLCGTSRERRRAFPVPAINASQLDGLVLRLARGRFTPERMQWLDAPSKEQLEVSRKRLQMLGALNKGNKLTKLGEEMVTFPVDPNYARMICEAQRRDVLEDVLVMVAVASTGRAIYDTQDESLVAQANAYDSEFMLMKDIFVDTYRDLQIANPRNPDAWLEERGIIPRRFHRAYDVYLDLCERTEVTPFTGFKPITKEKDMIASIFSGLWVYGVWQVQGRHGVDLAGNRRLLSNEGAMPEDGKLIVGEPFNLNEGRELQLYLLQRVTGITKKIVKEVLPGGWNDVPYPAEQAELQKVSQPPRKGRSGKKSLGNKGRSRKRR